MVTEGTSAQVTRLRCNLHTIREQRPKLRQLAVNLQTQMSLATDNLKGQHIDYDTVHTIEGAGDVAQGLDGLSTTLDAQGVRKSATA